MRSSKGRVGGIILWLFLWLAFSYGYGYGGRSIFLWIIESGLSCMAICSGEPPAMEEREQLSCGASPDSIMDFLMAGLPLA